MNAEKCKGRVYDRTGWGMADCSRKAWKDGYCKQHHPDTVAERNAKRNARWDAESEARHAKWTLERTVPKMRDLLRELVEECAKFQHDHPIPDIARRAAEILAGLDEK